MPRPSWITKLLEQGYAPYSQAGSRAAEQTLATLKALDLIRIEFQGTRRKVVVVDKDQFRRWVEAVYPLTDLEATADLPLRSLRSQNIARRRSSKLGRTTHEVQPVLLKWFDPNPASPLAVLTDQHGLVGLTTDRLDRLALPPAWWLLTVENWESFYTLDYAAPATLIVAIYLGGQVAEATLAALAQLSPPPERVLHFGDYDWTGLAIFQRVQAALPAARLYVPADIETLFQRYGNRQLLEEQAPTVQLDPAHAACQAVVDLIAECNAGLEQEVVSPPAEKDF